MRKLVVFVGGFGSRDLRPFIMPHFFLTETGLEWKLLKLVHQSKVCRERIGRLGNS